MGLLIRGVSCGADSAGEDDAVAAVAFGLEECHVGSA
jgi:hypothetical protein